MTRIAAALAGLALIAGVLCLPAVAGELGAPRSSPWVAGWDEVFGHDPALTVVVLALGAAAALVLTGLGARIRERAPREVPSDGPPAGTGPAQAIRLLGAQPTTRTLLATLLHAAERGGVTLGRTGDAWTVSARRPATPLDAPTAGVVARLTAAGDLVVRPGDVAAGERVQQALAGLGEDLAAWGRAERLISRGGPGPSALLLGVVGAGGVLACLRLRPWDLSLLGVVPGSVLLGAVALARAGAGRRRTRRGRRLWGRVAGYRRLLSAPSSKRRADLDVRPERYAADLPWAVAFGCTRAWAAKHRTETGTEAPVPGYLPPYRGAHTVDHVDAALDSLTRALDGALAAYAGSRGRRVRRR